MKNITLKTVLGSGLCLFGVAFARPATAEPSPTDKSVAAQLFEDGRALLEQGHIDQACQKLEESQRLDPGGGTLLNVALCHERQGRTATAWLEFVEARGVAKADNRPVRVAFAQTHIAQLEPVLSRVVVQVPSASDVPDLEIRRDGSIVGRAAWGSALPVDPGDHVVEAAAPGKISWRQSLVIAPAGDTRTVVVPALQDVAVPAAAPSSSTTVVLPPVAPPPVVVFSNVQPSDSSPRPGSPGLTAAGWIVFGLGVASAGASTYFGLHALSLKNTADRECPGDACSPQGASTNHDAIQSANISTGFAASGIVGLGVGTILLVLSAPHHASHPAARSSPELGPRLVGCDLSGSTGRGQLTILGRF
jgi:hypothetical protein